MHGPHYPATQGSCPHSGFRWVRVRGSSRFVGSDFFEADDLLATRDSVDLTAKILQPKQGKLEHILTLKFDEWSAQHRAAQDQILVVPCLQERCFKELKW